MKLAAIWQLLLLYLLACIFVATQSNTDVQSQSQSQSQSQEVQTNDDESSSGFSRSMSRHQSTRFPTAQPTYSPDMNQKCLDIDDEYSHNVSSLTVCNACLSYGCNYCVSDKSCFGTNNGTCESWVSGSTTACIWNGNLAVVVVVLVITILLVCCCLAGVVALLCFGIPACCASVCYLCARGTASAEPQYRVHMEAPIPTQAVVRSQPSYGVVSQTPVDTSKMEYPMAQVVSVDYYENEVA